MKLIRCDRCMQEIVDAETYSSLTLDKSMHHVHTFQLPLADLERVRFAVTERPFEFCQTCYQMLAKLIGYFTEPSLYAIQIIEKPKAPPEVEVAHVQEDAAPEAGPVEAELRDTEGVAGSDPQS